MAKSTESPVPASAAPPGRKQLQSTAAVAYRRVSPHVGGRHGGETARRWTQRMTRGGWTGSSTGTNLKNKPPAYRRHCVLLLKTFKTIFLYLTLHYNSVMSGLICLIDSCYSALGCRQIHPCVPLDLSDVERKLSSLSQKIKQECIMKQSKSEALTRKGKSIQFR